MYKTYFNKNNTVNVSCSKHVGSLNHDIRYSVVRYDGGSSSPAAPPLRLPPLSVWEICVCEYTVERIKVILWCVWEISSGVRLLLRELSSFKCCPEFEMLYQFKRWLVSVSFTSLVSSRRLIILLNWTTQQLHPIRMQQTSALKQINVSSCREENIVRKHQPLRLCSSDETVTKFVESNLGVKSFWQLYNCVCVSRFYLLGVVQRGVSVVRRFKAAHQAGVKASAAFDEPPRHGQLLLQQFIECKYGWIEGADSWGRDRRTLTGFMLNVVLWNTLV